MPKITSLMEQYSYEFLCNNLMAHIIIAGVKKDIHVLVLKQVLLG